MNASSATGHQLHARCFLLVLLAALCSLTAQAADSAADPKTFPPPKRAVIPKVTGSVTIDGKLDEPLWKQAAVLTPFFRNDGSGREREGTEVRIGYDDAALYLAWTCRDADVQATFTARDSRFWEEEVAEFFVTPKELTRYFELQWNPLGGVFDAIITNQINEKGVSRNFDGDWNFTAKGMESSVKLQGTAANSADRDEGWVAEVRIPFSDFSVPAPKNGDTWRANFYRFNRTKGQAVEQLSWSPTHTPSFHEPNRFGYLEFAGPK